MMLDPDLACEAMCIEDVVEATARGFPNRNRMKIHDLAEEIAEMAQEKDVDFPLLFGKIDVLGMLVQEEEMVWQPLTMKDHHSIIR
jgi:hypothetical protein